VIRVAGNVLDHHRLGSIEYAASHLGTNVILMLGHTRCGAVAATIKGATEGYVRYITDDILEAFGNETDDYKATVLNVKHGVNVIRGLSASVRRYRPKNLISSALYIMSTPDGMTGLRLRGDGGPYKRRFPP